VWVHENVISLNTNFTKDNKERCLF